MDLNLNLLKSNSKIYSLKDLLDLNLEKLNIDLSTDRKPYSIENDYNDELNISKNSNMNKYIDQFNDNKSESLDD